MCPEPVLANSYMCPEAVLANDRSSSYCLTRELQRKDLFFRTHLYESRCWVFDEAQPGFDAQDILDSRVQHFLAERAGRAAVAATLFHQALHRPFDIDIAATKRDLFQFSLCSSLACLGKLIIFIAIKSRLLKSFSLTSPSGCHQR